MNTVQTLEEAVEGLLQREALRDNLLLQLVDRIEIIEEEKSVMANREPPDTPKFPAALLDLGYKPPKGMRQ
jgi:hypothetical protein